MNLLSALLSALTHSEYDTIDEVPELSFPLVVYGTNGDRLGKVAGMRVTDNEVHLQLYTE